MRLLGAVPDGPPPLAAAQVERVDLGDVVREKVTYAVERDERVPAFLFLPKTGAAPLPAVLCHHQHGGEFDVGKDGPAGLGSTPDQHYAIELARRGYVTLAPDAICFNERRDPAGRLKGAEYERYQALHRLTEGKTLQGKYVWDARRAIDYLVSRPEVDRARIGMIGHSLGGQETLFTTAADLRIKAAVSSCGFASLAVLKRDHLASPKLGPVCLALTYSYDAATAPFLRAVLEKNPSKGVQAEACLALAQNLAQRAEVARRLADDKAMTKLFENALGKETAGELTTTIEPRVPCRNIC